MEMYWMRRKMWQIKNLIKWIPVIWKQYDYDYESAIDVFAFQLNKIADFLDSEEAYTVSAKANASQIRRTVKLLEDVYDEKFAMEYMDEFETSFDKPFIRKELKRFKECQRKQEKAHKLVWKLIEHYIRSWWD